MLLSRGCLREADKGLCPLKGKSPLMRICPNSCSSSLVYSKTSACMLKEIFLLLPEPGQFLHLGPDTEPKGLEETNFPTRPNDGSSYLSFFYSLSPFLLLALSTDCNTNNFNPTKRDTFHSFVLFLFSGFLFFVTFCFVSFLYLYLLCVVTDVVVVTVGQGVEGGEATSQLLEGDEIGPGTSPVLGEELFFHFNK